MDYYVKDTGSKGGIFTVFEKSTDKAVANCFNEEMAERIANALSIQSEANKILKETI